MLLDAYSATEVPEAASTGEKAVASFLKFIEKRLGVAIVRDTHGVPPDMVKALQFASLLKQHGVIDKFGRSDTFPDLPQLKAWYAVCNEPQKHDTGGTTWWDNADALTAALAEALERYIWFTQDDYYVDPRKATLSEIQKIGRAIPPQNFAGLSVEQREKIPWAQLHDVPYLWIQGRSLVYGDPLYLPAQTVSGHHARVREQSKNKEPFIRQSTTIGLATWPTREGALVAGINEILEREAYMVMWLNQLTLPRVPLRDLCGESASLAKAIQACERYRLKPHVIPMLTDAPTHAVAVVVEDTSGHAPKFTIGLRAHRNMAVAVEKALTETLRANRGYRLWVKAGNVWDNSKPVSEIGHRDRLYYWGDPENAKHMEFLVKGPEKSRVKAAWEGDTEKQHLDRLIAWCRERKFECISVPLTSSQKNPTKLFIEMVVMPDAQSIYLKEQLRAFGGSRWREIPSMFGYAPRITPFADRPHPFS